MKNLTTICCDAAIVLYMASLAMIRGWRATRRSLRSRMRRTIFRMPACSGSGRNSYGTTLSKSDFKSYQFHETWGGTLAEGVEKVHAFFQTPYFAQIKPMPGAAEAMAELKSRANLVVVTSRQHVIAEHTIDWLGRYYPGQG